MGSNESTLDKGIQHFVTSEFEKVRKDKTRPYLTLSEVLNLCYPEDYPFTFSHIGNLFVLNDSKDGRFSLEELFNFAKFCNKKLKNLKTYEFQSQLQAASTTVLWQSVRTEDGENDFVAWVGRLLYENEEVVYFPNNHEVAFIKIESVKLIYEIFDVKTMNGMDIQAFIDLLQQCGEEAGLMALECEEYDQYVPLIVCQDFAKEFIRGLAKLMKEIGFDFVV